MKNTYLIAGMTCQSCVKKIKDNLSSQIKVKNVEIDFDKKQLKVESKQVIGVDEVSEFLAPLKKYKVSPFSESGQQDQQEQLPEKNLKTYWPLILVLSYILFGVVHLSWLSGDYVWTKMMSDFMGLFFLAFGFFKMLDFKGFATSYSSYDLPTKLWPKWAYIYPFIEISLGMLYLHKWLPLWTNILTLLVMGLSIVGVIQAVVQKRKIKCVCLGTGFNLPMSTVTIVEDALMMLMALFMLWSQRGLI